MFGNLFSRLQRKKVSSYFEGSINFRKSSFNFATTVVFLGISSLWKGNISATYLWISYSMIQFSCYAGLKALGEAIPDPFATSPSSPFINDQLDTSPSKVNVDRDTAGKKVNNSTFWKTFVLFCAGAGAGMIATASTYPFDIIRTQFALQGKERTYTSINAFVTKTISNHGMSGLYSGLPAALVGIMPYMGLNFALYESVKKITSQPKWKSIDGGVKSESSSTRLAAKEMVNVIYNGACGALAGGLSKFMVFPLDTIKKKMQGKVLLNALDSSQQKFSTISQCLEVTLQNEGVKGLYRGIVPATLKSVAATAVTFAAYEAGKDILRATEGSSSSGEAAV